MAIQFARLRVLTRSKGHNVVRSAAYNARSKAHATRTGETFNFADRDGLLHHEVLLPVGAPTEFYNSEALWNGAQLAETRVNSQEAKELLLALPGNVEISNEDRIAMTREFVQAHFVDHGLSAQFDIHSPHEKMERTPKAGAIVRESEENYHAHVLISTRRLDAHGFGAKARDLNGNFAGGFMVEGERWGELWRDAQNEYFMRHGIDLRVDDISLMPSEHIGPQRMRTEEDVLAINRNAARDARSDRLMRDPAHILEVLTRQRSTFTVHDLDRLIDRQGLDEESAAQLFEAVIRSDEVLYTVDDRGELSERFTTRSVRREEEEIMVLAASLDHREVRPISKPQRAGALLGRNLSEAQCLAFDQALDGRALTILRGRAGTGKSHLIGAMRSAYARSGDDVIGLAPTHGVATDLRQHGFEKTSTVHSFLFRSENGLLDVAPGSKLVVEEAAMLDSNIMCKLLRVAHGREAHLILVGDDRQLSAIERGGIFTDLADTYGAVELADVRRQVSDWSRDATINLARGHVREALNAYDARGFVLRAEDSNAAMAELVKRWRADHVANPTDSQFVFAYRNVDVDRLNRMLRRELQALGAVGRDEVVFRTRHGKQAFAKGDRIQITETNKDLGLVNGMRADVYDVNRDSLTIELNGALETLLVREFTGFRHGYAGTLYKGQGRTVDHAYLFHTKHWGQASSYVALSRHRKSAHIFVNGEFNDPLRLARSMARDDRKLTSLSYEVSDRHADGKVFEINNRALLDTYEQAQADYSYLRRFPGEERAAAFIDMQLDTAALEIANHEAARAEAERRGQLDRAERRVHLLKSGIKDLSRGSRLVMRSLKLTMR